MMDMTSGQKLRIHYFLENREHSLDALVRNKCEHELLSIAQYIIDQIGAKSKIESMPLKEGGLVEIWQFIAVNNIQLTIVIPLIIGAIKFIPTKKTKLENEKLGLENEKLRLEIDQIRNGKNGQFASVETIDEIVAILAKNLRVIKAKSKLFTALQMASKITDYGFELVQHDESILPSYRISKAEFPEYIRINDDLPVEIDEDARIFIIAPVLVAGKYQWKGNYNGETISFSVLDKEFKSDVQKQRISFKNGTIIVAQLEIERKSDDLGNEKITGYRVTIVKTIIEGEKQTETSKGRELRESKKSGVQQMQLDL